MISVPPHKKALATVRLTWSNVSFHCLNSVFALFEVIFSAVLPQRWTHAFVILGIMILYVAMAYLIRLWAHFYVYDFLDTKMLGPLTAAYIFGIGAMGAVTFFVVQGIVWVKGAIGGRGIRMSPYESQSRRYEGNEVDNDVQVTTDKIYATDMKW